MVIAKGKPDSAPRRGRLRRRLGLAATAVVVVTTIVVACPLSIWIRAWVRDRPVVEFLPTGYVDDASRLDRTHVAQVWSIPSDQQEAEAQLRELIRRARDKRLPIAIGGARHSMGGHTISPDGIVIDMLPFNHMELDPGRQILHVGSGARWRKSSRFSMRADSPSP